MDILTINLNSNSNIPLYIQLYEFIKSAIQDGTIINNSKLPSKRKLSKHLGVSQNTIEAAYEQLSAEGYIISVPRKGYYVSEISNIIEIRSERENYDKKVINKNKYKYEFYSSRVDEESFPYSTWRRIYKEVLSNDNKELLQIGHPLGDRNLREAINNYLKFSRGVNTNTDNIIIGSGSEYLFQLIINILGRNKEFAVEEPGYYKIKNILSINGIKPIGITIDNYGISVDKLRETKSQVIHVTPSHQYPTGIIMPINRRLQILNWANEEKGRYIIEDDYDSEFRFEGKPIPALQSLDNNDKVIYLGTFSKSFSPGERIAYMVLPDELIEIYNRDFSFLACTVSRYTQQALTRFIEEGYFERHLNKMRNIYRKKREYLVFLIKENLSNVKIIGTNSGLHLLLSVDNGMTEEELINTAKNKGVRLLELSKSYLKKNNNCNTVFLGYSNLRYEEMKEAVLLIKDAWNI